MEWESKGGGEARRVRGSEWRRKWERAETDDGDSAQKNAQHASKNRPKTRDSSGHRRRSTGKATPNKENARTRTITEKYSPTNRTRPTSITNILNKPNTFSKIVKKTYTRDQTHRQEGLEGLLGRRRGDGRQFVELDKLSGEIRDAIHLGLH